MVTDWIEYKAVKPYPALSDFVESFWMLINHSDHAQEMVILPDGRVDLFFTYSAEQPFHAMLMGLDTEPSRNLMPPKTVIFAVSLKLLAIEYLLHRTISNLPDHVHPLPVGFLSISQDDLTDLDTFSHKVSDALIFCLKTKVGERKRQVFKLIYASDGSIAIKELSEKVGWTSRQINRYFNQWFGISVKAYSGILRFRASFQPIKEGKLFPEQHFFDQSHFIREIKKYAGVIPKELAKNQNDRFIQFSTLPEK